MYHSKLWFMLIVELTDAGIKHFWLFGIFICFFFFSFQVWSLISVMYAVYSVVEWLVCWLCSISMQVGGPGSLSERLSYSSLLCRDQRWKIKSSDWLKQLCFWTNSSRWQKNGTMLCFAMEYAVRILTAQCSGCRLLQMHTDLYTHTFWIIQIFI